MIREIWALTVRELKHWYRVKMQILMTVLQPLLWLGLFGQAFNIGAMLTSSPGGEATFSAFFAGAPDYFSFMSVGMLAVVTLFTCMFSGMSIVWDRRFGFLNKLKVAPIARGAVPISRTLATVIRALIQASFVLLAAVIFTRVPGLTGLTLKSGFGPLEVAGIMLVLFLLAVGFSSLFTTVALAVENQEVLFGVINLLNLPIMFASAAMFPTTLMPSWLQSVFACNPLTWAADALRQMTFGAPGTNAIWVDIAALGLFALALAGASVLLSKRLLSNR